MRLLKYLFIVLLLLPVSARADGMLANKFTTAVAGTSINNIGTSIAHHQITWNVSGTASVCTVALDTSADGITWSAGGAIAGQTCTSNGTSTVANVIANYVRINMTALTVTAGSSVTVTWNGYVNTPSTGTITSCATFANGDIPFYTAATTLNCNDQLQWNNANTLAYTGVAQSTFEASYQNWLGTNPAKLWVTNEMGGTQFNTAFFQMEGLAATSPIGIWNSVHAHNAQPETYFGEIFGEVDNGQTVGSSVNLDLGTVWHGPGTVTQHKDVLASPNYTDSVHVTDSYSVWANTALGVSAVVTNHSDFRSASASISGGATITNDYGFYAENHGGEATTFSAAFFAATQTSVDGHSWAFFNSSGKSRFNALNYDTLATVTACAANGTAANPSVVTCSNNSAGMFSCSATASTGTCQVNTTVVTANSLIFITQDQADGGASQLNVTCNTANVLSTTKPLLVSKSAGASFTINLGTVTANPACFEFHIIN